MTTTKSKQLKPKAPKKLPSNRIAAYVALRAASLVTGWPKRFATDITKHDRECIARRTDQRTGETPPFLWMLIENGSHMIWDGPPAWYEGRKVTTASRAMDAAAGFAEGKWYAWDGVTLHACTGVDAAVDVLARLHEPACYRDMGCLCAGHARGNDAQAACDTSEEV